MSELEKQSLDFTSLNRLKKVSVSNGVILLLIPFVVLIPLIGAFISSEFSFFSFLLFVGGSALLISLTLRNEKIRKNNESAFAAFARQNNMNYGLPIGDLDKQPGTLFSHGHSKRADRAFIGVINGFPFRLFEYRYSVGSGKSRRNYDASIMEVTLPRLMPHMVIDSLVEDGNGGSSTLPIVFDNTQRIELEGDFHKFFSLYAPDSYGVSALTVIAPDAMEALLRHAALCDIEIIDNKLYFYWPKLAMHKDDFSDIFSTTQEVLLEIGKKLSRGDIFAHESQAKVHAESTTKGVRLRNKKFQIMTVLGVTAFIGGEVISEMDDPPLFLILPFYFLIGGVAGVYIYRLRKRKLLLNELQLRYQKYRKT